jgi:hypothetical protein
MSLVLIGFKRIENNVQALELECIVTSLVLTRRDATLTFGRDDIGCYHIRRLVGALNTAHGNLQVE